MKMTKFKRVLSYKELQAIVEELMWSIGDSFGFGMDVANAVQDAILAKIGEQEPVAWIDVKKLEAMHKDSRFNRVQWKTELRVSQAEDDEIPLYSHPMPNSQGILDSSNCIPDDNEKNVTEGYALVPVEADQALLISMACCLNHGFGLLDKEAQDSMLHDMEKLYKEVVGAGYYSQENRERYLAMLADEPKLGERE